MNLIWLPGTGENPNYEYAVPLLPLTPQSAKTRKRDRDRAEALRLAGGQKPSLRDRAVVLARKRGLVRVDRRPNWTPIEGQIWVLTHI